MSYHAKLYQFLFAMLLMEFVLSFF